MSEKKKRSNTVPALEETFGKIKDYLIKIKTQLSDNKLASGSLLSDLYRVATLAESFTAQRPKSNKNWVQLADELDREGVGLWNSSGLIRQGTDAETPSVVAALRLAGFRLVEAGLEKTPGIQTLLHVLQLASKCAAILSELGDKDRAASVLVCAAKYEELLQNADDPEGSHRQAKARATVVYYSSRMEAAWREGNEGVAEFMLQKITDDDQRLAHLPPADRKLVAVKLLGIGKTILRRKSAATPNSEDNPDAQDAVRWMQKAYNAIELLEDTVTPGLSELKRSILRSLARAYFVSSSKDPENLTRAETALQELITSIDGLDDDSSSEYQQLRWMRLAVLKRRETQYQDLLEAFRSIIEHMGWEETDVTDLLQELRTLNSRHDLVSAVMTLCLQRALSSQDPCSLAAIDRLLLSLIFHSSKADKNATAMKDLQIAFDHVSKADFNASRVSATACLTLIWQYGDRCFHARKWSEAAEWFRLGAHNIFGSIGPSSSSKCFRKVALCHIQQREFSKAASSVRCCPNNEATTHYVALLIAIHQGLEDEAIKATREMMQAPDFDRKMLALVTQLSHESNMKGLLLSVLDSLLQTLQTREGDAIVEAMVLIRCAIRLIMKLLADPAAQTAVLIGMLVAHFITARTLVETALSEQKLAVVMKDLSWLWRTAYNCAVQGCAEWENSEDQVTDLFEIARELLKVYCNSAVAGLDTDIHWQFINASFAATSGRVFSTRRSLTSAELMNDEKLRDVIRAIQSCKHQISDSLKKISDPTEADIIRVHSYGHVLRVFEVEMLCVQKDWPGLKSTIDETVRSDGSGVMTFESIADILWSEKDCPTDVLFAVIEALLHASLDRSVLSIERFSRWLRAICTILLSRNSTADRAKALGYVEQAFAVMESSGDDPGDSNQFYPVDERQWLLGTSYNTGIECLHASLLDEAKRWFESSTVICKYVPDGQKRAEKISETYMQLLTRFAPGG